jgi:hypothetical protein
MEWSDANVEAALRTEIIESQRSQAEFLKLSHINSDPMHAPYTSTVEMDQEGETTVTREGTAHTASLLLWALRSKENA